jgi:hypothetical protein
MLLELLVGVGIALVVLAVVTWLGRRPSVQDNDRPTSPRPQLVPGSRAQIQAAMAWYRPEAAERELVAELTARGIPRPVEAARAAWKGLVDFFVLADRAPRGTTLGMPSVLIDLAWHALLRYPTSYDGLCRATLGRRLEHTPDETATPRPLTSIDRFKDDVVATARLCERHRLAISHAFDIGLPLLFATDVAFGVTGWEWSAEVYAAVLEQGGEKPRASEATSQGAGCGAVTAATFGGFLGSSHDATGSSCGSACSTGSTCGGSGCGGD